MTSAPGDQGSATGGALPPEVASRWLPLAGLLAVAGLTHFVRPGIYDPLIPRRLGRPRPWVLGSGAAEIACAAGLLSPRTRRVSALAAAALFVVVFPGNVQMAVGALRSPRAGGLYRGVTLARLPLQVPLVLWALRVADRERRESVDAATGASGRTS